MTRTSDLKLLERGRHKAARAVVLAVVRETVVDHRRRSIDVPLCPEPCLHRFLPCKPETAAGWAESMTRGPSRLVWTRFPDLSIQTRPCVDSIIAASLADNAVRSGAIHGDEVTSIDEVAQEQKSVDLRDRPALVDRSQATKVGGEVAGFRGRQAPRSKLAVGSEWRRPVRLVP
jgi:hypothetical protein